VGVDPADSGSGDACGIVATSMTGEGVVPVIADGVRAHDKRPMGKGCCRFGGRHRSQRDRGRGLAAGETYQRVVKEPTGAPSWTGL
jgi:hypothetical protein